MSVCFTRCDVILLLCYDTFRANIPVDREDLGQPLLVAHFLYNTSLHFCFILPGVVVYSHPNTIMSLHYCTTPTALYYVTASLPG
jgi:hypothetical protein